MDQKKKYIKDYYNKNAHIWTSKKINSFYHEGPFRKFEKLLKAGDRVLDIGCANAIHVPLFLGIGKKLKYVGIDLSKQMVKMAQSRYPQLKFSVADISKYKPVKKFDAFWAAAILMHIPENQIDEVLQNITRIIKPKAYGYVTLPTRRPNEENDSDKRHFTLYTKEKFKKLVSGYGWKIISSETLPEKDREPTWVGYIVRFP